MRALNSVFRSPSFSASRNVSKCLTLKNHLTVKTNPPIGVTPGPAVLCFLRGIPMKRSRSQQSGTSTRPAIRTEYERRGVTGFYRSAGGAYRNPHEPQLRAAIRRAALFERAASRARFTTARPLPNGRGSSEAPTSRDREGAIGATWSLDLTRVLDLAAGSGEATLALLECARAGEIGEIVAAGPFTFDASQAAGSGSKMGLGAGGGVRRTEGASAALSVASRGRWNRRWNNLRPL